MWDRQRLHVRGGGRNRTSPPPRGKPISTATRSSTRSMATPLR